MCACVCGKEGGERKEQTLITSEKSRDVTKINIIKQKQTFLT